MLVLHAEQMIDDLSVWLPFGLGRLLLIGVKVVDARDAIEIIKGE
jgi:hypothetical protein